MKQLAVILAIAASAFGADAVKRGAAIPADAKSITLAMKAVNPARPKKFNLGNIGPRV